MDALETSQPSQEQQQTAIDEIQQEQENSEDRIINDSIVTNNGSIAVDEGGGEATNGVNGSEQTAANNVSRKS